MFTRAHRGPYCYVTYFRHTLSHLVTHHVTSYFVYYFVQVLFRSLLSFRTMSPFIFVYVFLAFPSLYLSSYSVPSHCCLVLESPVRSGYLVPLGANRDRDRLVSTG